MRVVSRNNFKVETKQALTDHQQEQRRNNQERLSYYNHIARTNPRERSSVEPFIRSLESALAKYQG